MPTTTPVATTDPDLARELAIPCDLGAALLLERVDGVLRLRDTREGAPGPLFVDFDAPGLRARLRGGRRLPLARAVGLKRDRTPPRVLDATAGLGRDAFVLAALGCHVTAMERSPVIAALLRDGLRRASNGDAAARVEVRQADARDALANERPDVVCLDPMFPTRGTALAKKEMQYMRALLPPDDGADLIKAALESAGGRIVVKRPVHAPRGGRKPTHTYAGKTVRFDVYVG